MDEDLEYKLNKHDYKASLLEFANKFWCPTKSMKHIHNCKIMNSFKAMSAQMIKDNEDG